ncbi:MAG: 6-phosphogluconolactonase, partial [Clostridiales bacterium]|nr:6-phosphogluconolactonase [Clostridiales bacterium]
PTQAYTMGIGYIMKSETVILMATGAGKKGIVEKAFCGPVTPRVPASILQLHPNVVVIGDEAAISDAVVAVSK